jgi:glycerophosphoryl diester phosphodiesterase
MGNSFSTCDCIDHDTFEDNIRTRQMKREIKKQQISELSKKKFYSISDDDVKDISETEEVQVLDDYKSKTEEIKTLHIETKEPDNVEEIKIINPKSPVIKHIDEIINYLKQIPTNQELQLFPYNN